jgi:hypothetical protein
MTDIERLAAENAKLKALLSKQGFKIVYKSTGDIDKVIRPRSAPKKYTAVTWARKRGYKNPMGLVKQITKNKPIGLRKFKNAVDRAEKINNGRAWLLANGYSLPEKFFARIPNYVLNNNDFYENVNAILNSMAEGGDAKDLDERTIRYSMKVSVERIKRANRKIKKLK